MKSTHNCNFKNAQCINSVGSFTCDCEKGFQLDSITSCSPVNMCEKPVCPESADCAYTGPGEYTCNCRTGYFQNGGDCLRKYSLCCLNWEIRLNTFNILLYKRFIASLRPTLFSLFYKFLFIFPFHYI